MDGANATKIHTPSSAKRYFAVQRQFRDRKCILAPRGRAPFGQHQKERLWGQECRKGMPKVIADIAQHDGNVLFLFH